MAEKVIETTRIVSSNKKRVWNLWTTGEGIGKFFCPNNKIELKIGGAFELYFLQDNEPGTQGSEGCKILSYIPYEMLSFSWNAPPQFPNVRDQHTWCVVRFEEVDNGLMGVDFVHLGWGEGEEWDQVYAYFQKAWNHVFDNFEKAAEGK